MKRYLAPILCFTPLLGQSEGRLADFFETKQVVVKIDMPATQQGIDLYPQRSPALDLKSYQSRLKQFGVALRSGDSVMVTKVHMKDKAIEFQLGGGGYGTLWDDTDTSVPVVNQDKSRAEKDLENQVRAETNADRKRQLQRELDDMRRRRERDIARDQAAAAQTAVLKKERIESKRLQGGSRFNIRYEPRIPSDLTPEGIMGVLAQYLSFPPENFGGTPAVTRAQPSAAPGTAVPEAAPAEGASGAIKKGMTRQQVEALLGEPAEMTNKTQDGMKFTSCTYQQKDSVIKADFVDGVLVRYSIASQ